MKLDLSSLKKAVVTFEKTLSIASSEKMHALDKAVCDAVRAGAIQNFEFTYELCWKFMQRWLKENQIHDADLPRTRKELFRIAARNGLIRDPLPWFEYAEARNLISHTYSETIADTVFQAAVKFIADAQYCLRKLEEKND